MLVSSGHATRGIQVREPRDFDPWLESPECFESSCGVRRQMRTKKQRKLKALLKSTSGTRARWPHQTPRKVPWRELMAFPSILQPNNRTAGPCEKMRFNGLKASAK